MRFGVLIGWVWLALGIAVGSVANAQRYGFDTYSVEDGLPQTGVFDLLQTRSGHLWIASEGGGLARFDGLKFRVWDSEDGLPDNVVRCLTEDSEGNIWGGSASGGVFVARRNQLYLDRFVIEIPDLGPEPGRAHIRALAFDPEGALWIAALEEGLFKVEGGRAIRIPSDLPPGTRYRALAYHEGAMHAATDAGLAVVKDGRLTVCRLESVEATPLCEGILDLRVDEAQRLWVATEEGLYAVTEGRAVSLSLPDVTARRVRSVWPVSESLLWLGTDMGLFRVEVDEELRPVDHRLFTKQNGLSNERVRKVMVDDNDILWVGTYFGGISKLAETARVHYDERTGIERTGITCLRFDEEGKLRIGYFGGHIVTWNPKTHAIEQSFDINGGTDIRITDLQPMPNGSAVATSNIGTFLLVAGRAPVRLRGHISHDAASLGPDLIVAASDGLFLWRNETFSMIASGSFTEVVAMADTLLITESNGVLYALGTGELKLDSVGDIGARMTGSTRTRGGFLWLTTDAGRVYSFDGKKLRNIKAERFLPTPLTTSVAADPFDNPAIGSSRGLVLLETDTDNSIALNGRHFTPDNGLIGKEIARNTLLSDSLGRLWVGTAGGLQMLDVRFFHHDPTPPLPFLTDMLIGFEVPDSSDIRCSGWNEGLPIEPRFRHDQNHITFRWDAIELSGPDRVRYQFKLEGYDPEWTAVTINREVTYGRLPAGDYVFLLRSVNKDGVWNDTPLEYHFSVAAPLWASPWFLVACALFLIAGIWGFIRIRTAMLRRENLILEAKVEERTAELAAEKEKSEDLLLNILPRSVADELKEKGASDARNYPMATVLFSDFQDFTKLTATLGTNDLVDLLDRYFKSFDMLCARHGVEKIKTIGDAYMCATGLPKPDPDHATRMIGFAIDMIAEVNRINRENAARNLPAWAIRIGIHSGPVIAGVVGHHKFAYDIWGDTVNIASRMETHSEPFKINITADTATLIGHQFSVTPRGSREVKNRGILEMYFVDTNRTDS